MSKVLKPNRLNLGDKIRIISPASGIFEPKKFDIAKKYFENKGFELELSKNAKKISCSYLAGTDEERLEDLIEAFSDKSVKMVIASRGGFGVTKFIDKIDIDVVKNNPKIFCGYSDITALHSYFGNCANLVTFHSPFAVSDFGVEKPNKWTEKNFWKIITPKDEKLSSINSFDQFYCLHKGVATGKLIGGNLTVFSTLLGTKFFPDVKGKILFLEDLEEPLHSLDRMLNQMRLAGVFEKVSGLLVGRFTSIGRNQSELELEAIKLVHKIAKEYQIPTGYGFSVSHLKRKSTLPLNIEYELDTSKGSLATKEFWFN